MSVTKNVSEYVHEIGINLSELSRKTGIPYQVLYTSIGDSARGRDLRADELLQICSVLKVNPMDFADKEEEAI